MFSAYSSAILVLCFSVLAFSTLEKSTQEIANAMKDFESAGLTDTKMFNDLANSAAKNVVTMTELADGTKNVNDNLNEQKNILP